MMVGELDENQRELDSRTREQSLRGNRIGEEESVSLGVEAGSRSWEKKRKEGRRSERIEREDVGRVGREIYVMLRWVWHELDLLA